MSKVKGSPKAKAAQDAANRPASASSAPREPELSKVLSQTSRRHKVMVAIEGDDEFSVFSTSPTARKKDPAELNPQLPRVEEPEGGGKLLRFFKGFFS